MTEETTTFEAPVFSAQGKQSGTVQLPEATFDGVVNVPVMHQAVKAFLANRRQGTAKTKTRGEVTGGVDQAKARFDGWKQKKTRTDTEKARERHFEEQRQQEETSTGARQKETFGRTVGRVLVGLLALAVLIYLIVRHPNLPPWMAQQMVNQILEEYGF